ncbi:IS5 family transposase [Aliidiomarina quisquiliarum]|uniref:IS5 family transposase n=1 Tax=Aliidiomarina quisquiliarum TaxID=2938947 RepID=UPI00208FCCD3|nr:IS5 family transposase [Aliidiomarina quisquiliarum]MCO4320246.1 IS5 family transposase [Aliidiomarina quisquiliarum]
MQPSFFDLDDRHRKLNERDPLIFLNKLIDWEDFRSTLIQVREKPRKSNAGRKPYDVVLLFKMLILQQLYNISDDEVEFQVRDRYSFCRFLNLLPEDTVPDANTVRMFREDLTRAGLHKTLFDRFDLFLDEQGLKARRGQIIDASFVEAPKQRNNREENQQIKQGITPSSFEDNAHKKCQKDVDARWTKKNQETHYGYKNHVVVDNEHKLIRDFAVTSAEVHDSQVFFDLLTENSSKDVWADSAYRSEENDVILGGLGYRNQVHRKGARNKPLTKRQQQANSKKSSVRARVEHVFGSIENEQGGLFVRTIGLARATTKVCLMNLVYNMRRYVTLHRIAASAR